MQLFVTVSNGNLIPYSLRETIDTRKSQKTRHYMMIHILRNSSLPFIPTRGGVNEKDKLLPLYTFHLQLVSAENVNFCSH